MKGTNLIFQPKRAAKIQSRAIGLHNFVNVAYKTDGEPDGEPDAAKIALLQEIQTRVKTEIESRQYATPDSVQALVSKSLEGLPLEALRTFDADKLNTTIRNIAGELEKVKNARFNGPAIDERMLQRAVESIMTPTIQGQPSELELLMRSRGQGDKKEIVMNFRAAANMATGNTIDENNYPLAMIESVDILDEVVRKRRGEQYIYQIADRNVVANIEQYTTWLEEGNEQGAFAIVSEGAVKPLVSTSLVRNFAQAQKIAGKMVVTEEFVKWRQRAWAAIQSLLRDKLVRDYSAILTLSLQAQAASYVGTSLDDQFTAPTDYDAIGAVAAQIETLNFAPDVIIIHPQDKWRLTLDKDSQGRYYMMIPMVDPNGVTRMMGFRVVTSTYQTIGSFTLGEAGLFKIEEETITMRMGYGIDVTTATVNGTSVVTSVASDFDTNKFRVILETFFKNWIPTAYTGSFVTATFNGVKAALLKP